MGSDFELPQNTEEKFKCQWEKNGKASLTEGVYFCNRNRAKFGINIKSNDSTKITEDSLFSFLLTNLNSYFFVCLIIQRVAAAVMEGVNIA